VSGANENRPGSFAKRRALSQFRVALVFLVLGLAAAAASAAMLLSGTSTAIGAAALVFVGVAAKHFFDERLALGVRWGKGGNAEQAVGSLLDELRQDGFIVEHDLDDVVAGNCARRGAMRRRSRVGGRFGGCSRLSASRRGRTGPERSAVSSSSASTSCCRTFAPWAADTRAVATASPKRGER
jgi:hypothetical protein